MQLLGFVTLIAVIVPVRSANDWSVPCLNGTCEYDLPSSSGASGTLQIWGSNNSISDITPAAGWEILGCSSDEMSQDIRLVCMNNSTTCDHLYEGAGAEGKLVRLPESCGKSAFARVAKAWIPDDQSIPSNIAARVVRRDGNAPQVKALALDTDFSSGSSSDPVGFKVMGVNVPGVDMSPSNSDASQLLKRGFLDDIFGGVVDSVSDANSFNISNSTQLEPFDIDKKFNLFNQSIDCGPVTATVSADVNANAHFTAAVGLIASGTIIPPNVDQFALTSDFSAKLNGTLDLQGDLTGSFETPTLTLFEIGIPGLDFPGIFSIGPNFQINAQATAQLDVAVDMVVGLNYEIKNGHLVFPPSQDNASVSDMNATSSANMNMTSSDNSTADGDFQIQDTPLQLSLSPSAQANGSVSAHLIPTLNLGVSALGDVVKANVFLNLDTSATLQLSLEGSAPQANVSIGGRGLTPLALRAPSPTVVKPTSIPQAVAAAKAARAELSGRSMMGDASMASSMGMDISNSTKMVSGMSQDNSSSNSNSTNNDSGTDNSSSSNSTDNAASSNSSEADSNSGNFGGCFEILAGLDVNAGAEGNLFDIFDDSTQVTLFSKEFQLFQKCFGDQANNNQRRALSSRTPSSRRHLTTRKAAAKNADAGADSAADTKDNEKAGSVGDIVAALDCLPSNIAGPVSVVNDAVKALE
ncbi:hypothetical protein K435DRAFT_795246 [Dendrothele bispora CBS 962.96]|uniref:DUF7223 domain-containing protein n=1 Tax=Dendrothele bispora (strain CBS 962.96) TaxID=1314807 RepID=A0A4S8MAI5_DENBC|nr:hypothetical protein K435DRAFT_795246 [Dendrothele bispora CBS 962.96]